MGFGHGVCGAALIAAMYLGVLPLGAQEVDGSRFRAAEEGSWYHSVEPDSWVHIGGTHSEVEAVLNRIAAAGADRDVPDTPDYQGEGSWIAEWSNAGYQALTEGRALAAAGKKAEAVTRLKAAVSYFLRASSPHTDDPAQRKALRKAQESYALMAENHPHDIREIEIPFEGKTFTAWLHLPDTEKPAPVVIASMGSDVAKEELLPFFEKQLSIRGIGLLSVDMPGMGASADWRFSPDTDKIHAAAVEHLKTLADVDGRNLFVQGASFGGHASARAWLARPDLDLAGVVFLCGPLHRALMAPPEVYAQFPRFTMDGVRTRFGLAPDAGFDEIAKVAKTLSLKRQGLFDGGDIATPIFAILTNDDPVIPVEEVDQMLSRGTDTKKIVYDTPGHCPERDSREAMVASWVQDKLR